LRIAISQAIDKEGYVNSVLNNGSESTDGFTAKLTAETPDGKDFAESIDSPLAYNPKAAKKHLEKAKKDLGVKELTFTMNTEDTPGSKVSAEYIESEVEKNLPGVTMKVKQLPFKQRVNQEHSEHLKHRYQVGGQIIQIL